MTYPPPSMHGLPQQPQLGPPSGAPQQQAPQGSPAPPLGSPSGSPLGSPSGAQPGSAHSGPPSGPSHSGPSHSGPSHSGPSPSGAEHPSGAPTAYLPRASAPQGQPPGPPLGAPHAAPPAGQPDQPMSRLQLAVTLFAVASVAAVVLGVSVPEDGHNAWHTVKAWGGVALLAAALTLAPALGSALRLSAYRAWQIAAGGAAGLGLYWVLFVLPDISKNTSLITTLGVAAGIVVAWIAPGRQPADGPSGAHSASRQNGSSW